MKTTLALVLLFLLTACTTPLKPSNQVIKDNPIVVLNCPELSPFPKEQEVTFGDLLLKFIQITNQYHLCKASATTANKPVTKIENANDTRLPENR